MFGPHLMLDCYDCHPESMGDAKAGLKFLKDLAKHIDMTIISGPHLIDYGGRDNSFDDGGFSATLVIAESHITIHTFKGYNYMNFDIFSCKPFNIEKAIKHVIKKFKPKTYEKKIVFRGEHFPQNKAKLKVLMAMQRKANKK